MDQKIKQIETIETLECVYQVDSNLNQKGKQFMRVNINALIKKLRNYYSSNRKNYSQQDLDLMLSHLIEYRPAQITHDKKLAAVLIRNIPKISFPNLKRINFGNCNLVCIQNLAYFNAPQLQNIELYGNQITKIKPLIRNTTLTNLYVLTLYRNPINDMHLIPRTKSENFTYFELDTQKNDKVFCEDLSFVFKMKSQKSQKKIKHKLWIGSQNRILSQQLKTFINRKDQLGLILTL